MRLLFTVVLAILLIGAGLSKPDSPSASKEEIEQIAKYVSSLKEYCNARVPAEMRPMIKACLSKVDCPQSCSQSELELLALFFPDWHQNYTKAIGRCVAYCMEVRGIWPPPPISAWVN